MASSLNTSFLIAYLLVAFLMFINLSSSRATEKATNDELINQVCSKAMKPTQCLQALKSDPRSATADLKGLGLISIDLAQTSANSTFSMIRSLIKGTTNPKLVKRYETCYELYYDSIIELDESRQFLVNGDYESVNICAAAARTDAYACDDTFEGPPSEPYQLRQANQELQDLSDIALIISNLLPIK